MHLRLIALFLKWEQSISQFFWFTYFLNCMFTGFHHFGKCVSEKPFWAQNSHVIPNGVAMLFSQEFLNCSTKSQILWTLALCYCLIDNSDSTEWQRNCWIALNSLDHSSSSPSGCFHNLKPSASEFRSFWG